MPVVKELRERRAKLEHRHNEIVRVAEKEDRAFKDDEKDEIKRIHAEFVGLGERIEAQNGSASMKNELDQSVGDRRIAPTNATASPNGDRGSSGGQALFRDQTTGKVVRALGHSERLADQEREAADDHEGAYEGERPSVGDYLVARLTGRVPDGEQQQYKMLGESDGSGGILLEPQFGAGFIDLARAASVCSRAGAGTLRLDRAEMIFAVLASDPVSTWRFPGTTVPTSDATMSRITMHPRTLACVVPVQLELIEDAPNAGQILQHSLSASMGLALDQAALGVNAPQPAMPIGLLNTPGINTIAAVGTPTNYSKIGQAVTDILSANFSGEVADLAWCMSPRDAETFDGLVDSLGQPLRPTPFAAQVKRFHTTSFPINGGEGSNQSSMIVGDFSQMVIGMRTTGVTIRVLESGMFVDSAGVTWDAATSLQRLVVAHLRADVAILRPTFFSALTGVTAA
jgi:HK97 family phage major capsid protein